MIPYLVPLLLAAIGIVCFDILHKQRASEVCFWTIALLLTLLYGLSDGIGYDVVHLYSPQFTLPMNNPDEMDPSFAPIFKGLFWWMRSIGCPFTLFLLLSSTFINGVVFWFIRKYTTAIFTAAFLYAGGTVLLYNVEIIRQAMATAIFLLAIPSLLSRRYLRYFLLILLAVFFHKGAIFFLIVPLVYKVKLRFNRTLIIYLFSAALIFWLLFLFVDYLAPLLGDIYAEKIQFYSFGENFNIRYYIYHCSLICLFPALICAYYKLIKKRKVPFEEILCLMILLTPGVPFFGRAVLRLGDSFFLFLFVALASLAWPQVKKSFSAIPKRRLTMFIPGALFVLILLGAYSYEAVKSMTMTKNDYYPYRTVLANEPIY